MQNSWSKALSSKLYMIFCVRIKILFSIFHLAKESPKSKIKNFKSLQPGYKNLGILKNQVVSWELRKNWDVRLSFVYFHFWNFAPQKFATHFKVLTGFCCTTLFYFFVAEISWLGLKIRTVLFSTLQNSSSEIKSTNLLQ